MMRTLAAESQKEVATPGGASIVVSGVLRTLPAPNIISRRELTLNQEPGDGSCYATDLGAQEEGE